MLEILRIFDKLSYRARPDAFHEQLLDAVRLDWKLFDPKAVIDSRVERAILTVPRHRFTSSSPFSKIYNNTIVHHEGYDDSTASEPGLVAYMTQLVLPEDNIQEDSIALDIGCGLGYQTAMLKAVGFSRVIGVEIKPDIAQKAQRLFKDDPRVAIVQGDGKTAGGDIKFDAIVVAALANDFTIVDDLVKKLKNGGKLIIPVSAHAFDIKSGIPREEAVNRDDGSGFLILATRERESYTWKKQVGVKFVELI